MVSPSGLEGAEDEAIHRLVPELKGPLSAVKLAYDLIGKVSSRVSPQPLHQTTNSLVVVSSLLMRLTNDLRCIGILTVRGYPLQALTIASSVYEVAFAVACIAGDEDLASKWLQHDDPKELFIPVWDLTERGLSKLGVVAAREQAEQDYRVYRQFCMAKHSNPVLQACYGFQVVGEDVKAQNGPDTSELAVNNSWFAMNYVLRYVYIALAGTVNCYVPEELRGEIVGLVEALSRKQDELAKAAKERWGGGDPFPGKW